MEQELQKNNTQMEEIAYDILNIGEVISNLIEVDYTKDGYDETLWQINSLSTAVVKCCKELTETCNEGLEILFQEEAQELKQEEDKFTNEQLQMIIKSREEVIKTREDVIKTQNELIETIRETNRILKETKADEMLAEA